jgi:topoisomerase-4 subunit A
VKRFKVDETEKAVNFISEHPDSKLISLTEVEYPRFEIEFGGKHKERQNEIIEVAEFIGVKSYKAKGKRLTNYSVGNIKEIEPVHVKESVVKQEITGEEIEDTESVNDKNDTPGNDNAQMTLEL